MSETHPIVDYLRADAAEARAGDDAPPEEYANGMLDAADAVQAMLTPQISERGFAAMPGLPGLYGGAVTIRESSLATTDALWLDVRQDGDSTEATAHLDMGAALTLADQIHALAARRGYALEVPPAPPVTWQLVVRTFRAAGWAWRGHAGPDRTAHPLGDDCRPDRRAGSVTVTRYRPRTWSTSPAARTAPRLWRVVLRGPGLTADSVDLIDPTPAAVLEYAARLGLIRAPALLEPDGRAHIWREVASWVRHRCAHQFGVPVCAECLNLGDAIERQADRIGQEAER